MNREIENFILEMVDIYGVNSCFDNIDIDNPIEEEGYWFECPHCGEPILISEDWSLDEIKHCCPICEESWE